jgi:hypothetical protein
MVMGRERDGDNDGEMEAVEQRFPSPQMKWISDLCVTHSVVFLCLRRLYYKFYI